MVSNTIIQADCLDALPHLADGSVDLTVFSPPYDAIRDYHGGWALDHRALGQQLFRVTKDGGVCALVIGDGTKDFAKSLTTARWTLDWCDNAGRRLFEQCIYARHGNPGAWWSRRFRVDHEAILILFKGQCPKTFDKTPLMVPSRHAGKLFSGTDRQTDGSLKPIAPTAVNAMKCRGTVWQYAASNSEGNRVKGQHPATFPDALARNLILCFSAPGDLVLDPTAGSGTTCVAAAQEGRRYLGIDVSAHYCEIARQRLTVEVGLGLPVEPARSEQTPDAPLPPRRCVAGAASPAPLAAQRVPAVGAAVPGPGSTHIRGLPSDEASLEQRGTSRRPTTRAFKPKSRRIGRARGKGGPRRVGTASSK